MKNLLIVLIFLGVFTTFNVSSQTNNLPTCPEDTYITKLIKKLDYEPNKKLTKDQSKLCREIGIAFYNKGMYDESDWYLEKVDGHIDVDVVNVKSEVLFDQPKEEVKEELSSSDLLSIKSDQNFLNNLPKSYDNLSKSDMKKLANQIENQLEKLTKEKEELLKTNSSKEVIDSKSNTIKTLNKEINIIDLNIKNDVLVTDKKALKKYLWWSVVGLSVFALGIVVLLQRKTIKVQDVEIENQLRDINKKNTYLEYAARIIRHDMHSGINTYIPRGLSSLEKRITDEDMTKLKITSPIKMIKDGLAHTQKVYKSVYEFTNLVKHTVVLDKEEINIKESLLKYLTNTSYKNQVMIDELVTVNVNETLFWNAIDNLIKNGLRYNTKENKEVKIYMNNEILVVEDNGVGFSQKEFEKVTGQYLNKGGNSEVGLGLGITKTILEEHGFSMECEKIDTGTKIKIKIK
jgi:signal transduction histidine kinase